jgi:hypothetical protein
MEGGVSLLPITIGQGHSHFHCCWPMSILLSYSHPRLANFKFTCTSPSGSTCQFHLRQLQLPHLASTPALTTWQRLSVCHHEAGRPLFPWLPLPQKWLAGSADSSSNLPSFHNTASLYLFLMLPGQILPKIKAAKLCCTASMSLCPFSHTMPHPQKLQRTICTTSINTLFFYFKNKIISQISKN